jgi:hypothetical protein
MLESEVIDRLFGRLAVRYGVAWSNKWQGLDATLVKADWARELAGIPNWALAYALAHLPASYPPDAGEFANSARAAPASANPKQQERIREQVKSDLPRLRAEFERLHELLRQRNPRSWVADLRARLDAGETLTAGQLEALHNAERCPDPRTEQVDIVALDALKRDTQRMVEAYERAAR